MDASSTGLVEEPFALRPDSYRPLPPDRSDPRPLLTCPPPPLLPIPSSIRPIR